MRQKHYFTVNFLGDIFQSYIKELTLKSLIDEIRAMTQEEDISQISYYAGNNTTKMVASTVLLFTLL